TAAAFIEIVEESGRKPMKLNTDKGKEFLNATFQRWLSDKGITFFTANNPDIKASIVERFNRTLKTRLWKYFTWKETSTYIDVLPQFLESYNNRVHSSTGIAPNNVNISNSFAVYSKMFGKQKPKKKVEFKFEIGDRVRI